MSYLRYAAVLFALLMLSWHGYLYLSLDEEQIRAGAAGGGAMKFIQVDDEELQFLHERLADMKPFSEVILQGPRQRDFGRKKGVFLPD